MGTIKLAKLKNGTTTVSGLTDGDLRLLASALRDGIEWDMAAGHSVLPQDALRRLVRQLNTHAQRGKGAQIKLVGGTSSAELLYRMAE